MYIYYGQTFDPKTRVGIWMSMDVVPVEYISLAQMFHLLIWSFRSVTEITLRWNGLKCYIVALVLSIGLWDLLRKILLSSSIEGLQNFKASC